MEEYGNEYDAVLSRGNIEYGTVLSRGNIERDAEGRVLCLPVYLVMFLGELNAVENNGDGVVRLEAVALQAIRLKFCFQGWGSEKINPF